MTAAASSSACRSAATRRWPRTAKRCSSPPTAAPSTASPPPSALATPASTRPTALRAAVTRGARRRPADADRGPRRGRRQRHPRRPARRHGQGRRRRPGHAEVSPRPPPRRAPPGQGRRRAAAGAAARLSRQPGGVGRRAGRAARPRRGVVPLAARPRPGGANARRASRPPPTWIAAVAAGGRDPRRLFAGRPARARRDAAPPRRPMPPAPPCWSAAMSAWPIPQNEPSARRSTPSAPPRCAATSQPSSTPGRRCRCSPASRALPPETLARQRAARLAHDPEVARLGVRGGGPCPHARHRGQRRGPLRQGQGRTMAVCRQWAARGHVEHVHVFPDSSRRAISALPAAVQRREVRRNRHPQGPHPYGLQADCLASRSCSTARRLPRAAAHRGLAWPLPRSSAGNWISR